MSFGPAVARSSQELSASLQQENNYAVVNLLGSLALQCNSPMPCLSDQQGTPGPWLVDITKEDKKMMTLSSRPPVLWRQRKDK